MLPGDQADRFVTVQQLGKAAFQDPEDFVGSMGTRDVIISESPPSGTYPEGTIWLQLEPL